MIETSHTLKSKLAKAVFTPPEFDKIFIHPQSIDSEIVTRFKKWYPIEKFHSISEAELSEINKPLDKYSIKGFENSKKNLLIEPFKGQFFKRCPGATQKKVLNCCNYFVLNLGLQCPYDCSYCYLQSYINSKVSRVFSNINDAISELEIMATQFHSLPFRVGTGEVIDSLALDPITLFSHDLIRFFRKYPKWILEFKTKSANVDHFLTEEHSKNTVVSWSLNAAEITDKEEHQTASLALRLAAAKRAAQAGFPVAFHLDPLIHYPDWQNGYADLVDRIIAQFSPEDVNVISVGALRFQPEQRHLMKLRFGFGSYIVNSEMHPSEGDKLRYDRKIREEMYQFVLKRFKSNSDKWKIFFCMETPETWLSTFSSNPMGVEGLKDLFRPLPKIDNHCTK